jgi:effector-binding domain-containing protein
MAEPTTDGIELVEVERRPTAVVRGTIAMAELPAFFDSAFEQLATTLAQQERTITGPAFALYHGAPTEVARLEVGFPLDTEVAPTGDVEASQLPAGKVARTVHRGGFDQLGESWGRLGAWIGDRQLEPGESMWEVYLTEPTPEMDPADLRTELNWPVSG